MSISPGETESKNSVWRGELRGCLETFAGLGIASVVAVGGTLAFPDHIGTVLLVAAILGGISAGVTYILRAHDVIVEGQEIIDKGRQDGSNN